MGIITFVILYIYLPFVVLGILSIYFNNQPKTIGELVDHEDFSICFYPGANFIYVFILLLSIIDLICDGPLKKVKEFIRNIRIR